MTGNRHEGHPFREWLSIAWSYGQQERESAAVDAPPMPAVSPSALTAPNASLLVTIRAITADRPTRNHTYYPLKELRGDGESTGYVTFVRPYGVPVMLHHVTAPSSFGGQDSRVLPVGRVLRSRIVRDESGEYFVELTARITDPWAVDAIQRGLLYTVSIGHIPQKVTCSICGAEMPDDMECSGGHRRGMAYGEGSESRVCYAVMHGIQAVEVSFVNVPSDKTAVIRDIQPEPVTGEAYSLVPVQTDREGGVLLLSDSEALTRVVREVHGKVVAEAVVEEQREPQQPQEPQSALPAEGDVSEDEDRLCSAEELWFVSDDELPEWAQEAKLTAAQRRRLPDSAFCGPNRSFPAHDKAHVLAGLRLLGRAKLSAAQKARVRACLLRRARRFGLPAGQQADKEGYLLLLVHPFELESVHVLVLDTKEALETARVTATELLGEDGAVEYVHSPSLPGTMAVIPRSEQAYEALWELLVPQGEEPSPASAVCAAPSVTAAESVTGASGQEESSVSNEWSELAKRLFGIEGVECPGDLLERVRERYAALSAELEHYRGLVEGLQQERQQLVDRLASLEGELGAWKHRVLVDEAVRLAVAAGYPPARRRSYEQLQELFSARSDEVLEALIADLKESAVSVVPDDVEVPVPGAPVQSNEPGLPTGEHSSGAAESVASAEEASARLMKIIELLTATQSRPEEGEETERFLIPNLLGDWIHNNPR